MPQLQCTMQVIALIEHSAVIKKTTATKPVSYTQIYRKFQCPPKFDC
jgi:hypothetical protein